VLLYACSASCNNSDRNDGETSIKNHPESVIEKVTLVINSPVQVSNTSTVLYLLPLDNEDKVVEKYKSYDRTSYYWNVLFYNALDNNYHLLDDTLKMLIVSYTQGSNDTDESESIGEGRITNDTTGKLLYFDIITSDYNKDSILDNNDPQYLFIADKSGNNFKQVSPDNAGVDHWQAMDGLNKILMMIKQDTNKNGTLDLNDEINPWIYDVKSEKAIEILSPEYKLSLKNIIDKNWKQKKNSE
jgi:hypothetical protein